MAQAIQLNELTEYIASQREELLVRTHQKARGADEKTVAEILRADQELYLAKVSAVAIRSDGVVFPDLPCELLLQEASSLLDRCLQSRKEYRELLARWFEVRIQTYELLELSRIAGLEAADTYSKPKEVAALEAEAADHEKEGAQNAYNSLQLGVNANNNDQRARLRDGAVRAAFGQNVNLLGRRIAWPDGRVEGDFSAEWIIVDEIAKFAKAQTLAQAESTAASLVSAQDLQTASKAASTKRKLSLETSAEMKGNQAKYQIQRNDVARFVAARRALAISAPSGDLNFGEQLGPTWNRFINDFNAAWARIAAASKGLAALYDYVASLPSIGIDGKLDVDEVVSWVQKTNLWFASLLSFQETVTKSISLLKKLSKTDFENSRKNGRWAFTLSARDFPGLHRIRLRGVAIQVSIKRREFGSWNFVVVPPKSSVIERPDGSSTPLEQEHIGELHLGMVAERQFATLPEFHSPVRLFNAGPIGNWEIRLEGFTSSANVDDLEDIDLHLRVAVSEMVPKG